MSEELRTISLQNLPDAVHLMNESSRGMSLECHLDTFSFLALWRYWGFSTAHSLLRYVGDEAAAIILTCADPETREAYIFYWGALPKFRAGRMSIALFDACCRKLHDDGYMLLHGVSVPDRPVRRYRFIQALPNYRLIDMQTTAPVLPAVDEQFEIRKVNADALAQLTLPNEFIPWCQRHTFLRNASPFLQFVGAFAGESLKAYAAVFPMPSGTELIDLRSPESSVGAGYELLRWIAVQTYQTPFTATFVLEHSYAHGVLTAAGFAVKREFSTLSRDLGATYSVQSGHV